MRFVNFAHFVYCAAASDSPRLEAVESRADINNFALYGENGKLFAEAIGEIWYNAGAYSHECYNPSHNDRLCRNKGIRQTLLIEQKHW